MRRQLSAEATVYNGQWAVLLASDDTAIANEFQYTTQYTRVILVMPRLHAADTFVNALDLDWQIYIGEVLVSKNFDIKKKLTPCLHILCEKKQWNDMQIA